MINYIANCIPGKGMIIDMGHRAFDCIVTFEVITIMFHIIYYMHLLYFAD